jgi:predicted nucleic acid-binding protein
MKTYLFDSDVLIDFFNQQVYAVRLVERLSEHGQAAISVLSLAELCSGWDETQRTHYLPHLQQLFEQVPVSPAIAERAGAYRHAYQRKHVALPTINALIAATAAEQHRCLITRNSKDYPMPELELYPLSDEEEAA